MFGSVFSKYLHPVREAVGIYPSAHGLVYAHLCAPDDTAGVWSVSMLRRTTDVWRAEDDPGRLAALVREELARREETHRNAACSSPPPSRKNSRAGRRPICRLHLPCLKRPRILYSGNCLQLSPARSCGARSSGRFAQRQRGMPMSKRKCFAAHR